MNLAFITPAFGNDGPEQCSLLIQSAERVGMDLRLYGVGQQYPGHTEGKFKGAIEECKRLKDAGYTHVVYMDGFDTLIMRGAAHIATAYKMLAEPPILFAGEENCWPYADRFIEYPRSETPWRFLNGGAWMGELGYLVERLPLALQQPQYDSDDQGMLTQAYLSLAFPNAMIDHWCRVFQTMAGSHAQRVRPVPWQGHALNDYTGTYPCILHYNGRSGGREEMWHAITGSSASATTTRT